MKRNSKTLLIILGIYLSVALSITYAAVTLRGILLPVIRADNRNCVSDNHQVQLLKSYVPQQTLEKINPDFYTYFSLGYFWRAPLVYPYSIQALDSLERGYLIDESAVTNYKTDSANNVIDLLSGIQKFSFDRNYLLVDKSDEFIIFEFQSREMQSFETEQALIVEAKKLQFEGNFEFVTLKDYNALFTCGE
jgi:hypothetical protein